MAISVSQAYEIASRLGCRLLAGEKGFSRDVSFIDSIEQPDIEPWIRKNIFYITTGYAFRDDADKLCSLVKALNEKDAAALAIKSRFMESFPETVVKLAKQLDFPLILMPDDLPFIELSYPIMVAIVEKQNNLLEFTKLKLFEYSTQVMDNNLFVDILTGNIKIPDEADNRANALNWTKPPFRLAVMDIDDFESYIQNKNEEEIQNTKDAVINLIKESVGRKQVKCTVVNKNDSFTCIISQTYTVDLLKQVFAEITQRIHDKGGLRVSVGLSSVAEQFIDLGKLYEEARDAISIGRHQRNAGIMYIEEIRFEQALKRICKDPFYKEYTNGMLSQLLEYDRKNEGHLLETLETLIAHMGVRNTTAEALFLHRNTLAYRIKKIESLCGYSLDDSDNLFKLGLALKMRHYI